MFPNQNRLLIVDGHALAYRSFHAIRSLNAPDGSPTNAIFGFLKALGKLRGWVRPDYLLVAWDGGLAAERLEALPEYKAQRPPMPDSLARQIEGIATYLEAAGYASHCQEGVEADDWIATVNRRAVEQGAAVVIASPDKDFLQLVQPRVGLANPNDKEEKIWTEAEVRQRTGVAPAQVVDWLSLIGDSVDNIPGVPGVGPKTAAELLGRFGTVNAIYERLNEIKSERLRAALTAAEAAVRRNQALVRLNDQLAGEFTLADARPRAADTARLRGLFERWGFAGFLRELAAAEARQGELF
jgi:DNA polymerase-1